MTPALKEKWTLMSKRERLMVIAAGLVVGLGILFGLLIDPALSGSKKINQDLPSLRSDLAKVQAWTTEAKRLSSETTLASAAFTGSARTEVEKSLQRAGLKDSTAVGVTSAGLTSAVTITGSDEQLQIKINDVAYPGLMDWLNSVQKELRARVTRAAIVRSGQGARVTAEIELTFAKRR